MENRKWFTLSEGVVRGPFRKDDIESRISVLENTLIWGRGCSEWMPPDKWVKYISDASRSIEANIQTEERLWRIAIDDQEIEPMIYPQMLKALKTLPDLTRVRIWTEGYSDWKEIFQIHKIMDELGVSRRTHPRIPLMGTITCESAMGNFNARVLSISEGGLGATDVTKVKIGEKLKISVKSPQFHSPILATVEVVYVGNDGYFGMKFSSIQRESQNAIIEYINKFQSNQLEKG